MVEDLFGAEGLDGDAAWGWRVVCVAVEHVECVDDEVQNAPALDDYDC